MLTRRQTLAGMISATVPAMIGSRAASQEVINLTMSSSHPTTIAWVGPLKTIIVDRSNELLEERGSNYRINWTEAFGGSLYGFQDTMEAVTQQLTDMGWVGSLWEPSSLPLQNVDFVTPFSTQTVDQAFNAMNRMNDEQQAYKDEWAAQNIISFGCCGSDGYHLFTKRPIESLSDLEGLKLVGVPTIAPWIEPVGATLVTSGLPAMYGQIQTGVGDGTMLIGTGAYPLKLHEVAPFVTRVDTGPLSFGGFGINLDTYNSLPEDVQQVLAELGREYSHENARQINEREAIFFENFVKEGATVTDMPQEQRVEWADRLGDLAKLWVEEQEARGVPAREMLIRYIEVQKEEGAQPLRDWTQGL